MRAARNQNELPDDQLLRLARADQGGDEARRAASRLLGRYRKRVYVWCFRYVRDHEQALDLAQEVLLNAYRNLESFGGRAQFASWLFAIVRNRCLSELRRPALLRDEEFDLDSLPAAEGDPERLLQEKLDEGQVLELISATLERQEQEALWLRCFDKMPVDAITEVLAIHEESGARAVLQRARRKIRSALERQTDLEGGT